MLFAVLGGLTDSVNPCALVVILLSLIYVLIVAKSFQQALWVSILLTGVIFITTFILLLGLLDHWIAPLKVQLALRCVTIGAGIFLVIMGLLNFWDWFQYKKYQSVHKFIFKWPTLIYGDQGVEEQFNLKFLTAAQQRGLLGTIFFGIFIGLLESVWAPYYTVTLLLADLTTPGKEGAAFISLIVYNIIFFIPFFVSLGLVVLAFRSEVVKSKWRASIALVKIIFSAVLLASGVGAVYIFS